MSDYDEDPDADDVLQMDPYDPDTEPPVYVVTRGPVRVQDLPSKSSGAKGFTVSDTDAIRVLTADSHRSRALIVSFAQPFKFGSTQGELNGQCGIWPPLVPMEVKAVDELWVRCNTAATTDTISVIQERWAEGG